MNFSRIFSDLSNITHRRTLLFIVLSSIAGFVANLFPVYLFGNLTLIFGPAFSLLVAINLGPVAGAIVAFITSIALILSWEHLFGFFLFIPEAITVALLYRKGWNELLAVIMYWLVLIVPSVVLVIFVLEKYALATDMAGKYGCRSLCDL